MKEPKYEEVSLQKIVGEGRALGELADGRKVFVWGGLPGEKVKVQINKLKKSYGEGVVTEILDASKERVAPKDPDSYLSTSPWQIMNFDAEQHYKSALIEEAFELHDIVLPGSIAMVTDNKIYGYRNKVEFSFWWDNDRDELDLAFFVRGSKGKVSVQGTSLAMPVINEAAQEILQLLRQSNVEARNLKTLMLRANQRGKVTAQLYIKDKHVAKHINPHKLKELNIKGIELIHSNFRSPASVITERLSLHGTTFLDDAVLGIPFRYVTEGFFQVNIPVYEMALEEMRKWIIPDTEIIDMYSGVGTIGLTIGGSNPTLVEMNEYAVNEMRRNVAERGVDANIVHSSSEAALEYIKPEQTVILDPPRAGLHANVVDRLLEVTPPRIIYLSCNPVTQARDIALLAEKYGIRYHQGYNFFPRTPHIEHLVILDRR
jgi:23S rRNA (uracil1939-C5)-methyltransferase